MKVTLKDWLKLLEDFRSRGIRLVHILTLIEETGLSRSSLKVALWRLERLGLVCRIGKNWVCIDGCPPQEVVRAYFPAYISMEWALYEHGVMEQRPYVVTIIWLKPRRKFEACGYFFEAHRISERLFFGFDYSTLLAEPEKALLDLIYIRGPISYSINPNKLDVKKLFDYCSKYPKRVLTVLKDILHLD